MPIAAAAPLVTAAVTSGAWWMTRPPAPPPPIVSRFAVALSEGQRFTNLAAHGVAISPDGTQMAYVANERLYLRSMAELEARPITQEARGGVAEPVFSPDGRSLAFFSTNDNAIKRIAVTGGAAVTVCPLSGGPPSGMSWGGSGIMFIPSSARSIMRVSPDGESRKRW